MEATAGEQAAFMLGGEQGDNMTGGSAIDVLIRDAGNDIYCGGILFNDKADCVGAQKSLDIMSCYL